MSIFVKGILLSKLSESFICDIHVCGQNVGEESVIKVPPGRSSSSCDSKIFQKLLNNMPVYCLEKRGPSQAVALDMSKTFESVWLAGFLHKLKRYGMFFVRLSFLFFQVYFVLLWMGSLYKSALSVMRLHKAPFPWLYCFLNALSEGVIYNISNCSYFKCLWVSEF